MSPTYHNQHQTQQTTHFIVELIIILVYNTSNNIISIYFIYFFLLMGKVEFFGENFFLKVLVEGLNIIQFSQSKNEGNPKLLVYSVIYGCYGVFPASIELTDEDKRNEEYV